MTTHWSVGSQPTTTDAQPHAPCPHGNTGLFCQPCYEAGPYATIARLQARVQRLTDALTPFANMAGRYDPPEDDDHLRAWDTDPTIGQLRAARAAIAEENQNADWDVIDTCDCKRCMELKASMPNTKTEQPADAATDQRCALCQQPVQDSPWVCANAERHAFCRVCVEDWKGSFDCPIDGAPVVS